MMTLKINIWKVSKVWLKDFSTKFCFVFDDFFCNNSFLSYELGTFKMLVKYVIKPNFPLVICKNVEYKYFQFCAAKVIGLRTV